MKALKTLLLFSLIVAMGLYFNQDKAPDLEASATQANKVRSIIKKENPSFSKQKKTRTIAQSVANNTRPKQPRYFSEHAQQLLAIKDCYKNTTCDYPQVDPKSYHFAIGQDLKHKILKLESSVSKNNWQSPKISELANNLLTVEDGHVKEAALHLLATQEISEQSLDSLLSNIIDFHDPRLIKQAMFELKRYMGRPGEEKIHSHLSQALKTGAPLVSQEIALFINLFINSKSIDIYSQTLTALPPTSKAAQRLKGTVEEFERRQSAA